MSIIWRNSMRKIAQGNALYVMILIAGLILFSSCNKNSDTDKTGTVIGVVKEISTDEPIFQARVSVNGTNLSCLTDTLGRYEIIYIPSGSRTFVAAAEGYFSSDTAVVVIAKEIITIDYILQDSLAISD